LQEGELVFMEGDTRHEMKAGDCLELGRRTTAALLMKPTPLAAIWWFASIRAAHNGCASPVFHD
jgi:hypothetical protein